MNTRYLTKASLIAAIYIVLIILQMLVLPVGNLTFGPIQLRLAEGLALLPLVEPAAIPGLFVGVLLSNLILVSSSGFGIIDIIGGSLVTLVAAYFTFKMKSRITAMIPLVALNGLIVSIWVSYFTKVPYVYTALGIALGELASLILFGNLILYVYKSAANFREY
ncbi:MAG TPA: QueT transporter family protein [Tissierellaceae bacterium]|nr:QueT transporter family protein [Tissierellaceae bacterium]